MISVKSCRLEIQNEKNFIVVFSSLKEANEMLRENLVKQLSQNESERKVYAELKNKYLAKIKSLQSENVSLKTRLNELEAELQEEKSDLANVEDAIKKEIKKTKHFLLELLSQLAPWIIPKMQSSDLNEIEG